MQGDFVPVARCRRGAAGEFPFIQRTAVAVMTAQGVAHGRGAGTSYVARNIPVAARAEDQDTRLMASPRIETMSSICDFSTIRGGDNASESPLMRK